MKPLDTWPRLKNQKNDALTIRASHRRRLLFGSFDQEAIISFSTSDRGVHAGSLDAVRAGDHAIRAATVHHIGPPVRRPRLSDREIEVLLAWLGSDSKDQAARRLFVSASTVATHITRIRAKYDIVGRPAGSKPALFARAIQDGLTTLDEW